MEDRAYLPYPLENSKMDQSVPSTKVKPGICSYIAGVDGRFTGGLRKYYGNKLVLDLDGVSGLGDIDTYAGPSFFRQVTFQKRGTSTVYRGFVIRWDSQDDTDNQQIDLVYTSDGGSNWSVQAVWAAGNGITGDLEVDCAVSGGYLLVAVDTKATKTVYWNGAALTTVTSGPGSFSATLGALTENTTSVDSSYTLSGNGTYQVAYRFYDSTRGIYSALSTPVTIEMDHYKTSKASGTISFASSGGDSGLLIDGDVITINGRTYEADDDSAYTGDVQVDISGLTTISEMAAALTDAINGDASADVTATNQSTSVYVQAIARGTAGNAYSFSVSETGANTNDISASSSTLLGGGITTSSPETTCKAVLDFPSNTSVVSGKAYADFSALFDTVDVFRTIDLGDTTSAGAIFYLEQTIAKTGNWATSGAWDALTVTIGTLHDEALPFQTVYDPEKDIVDSPPQSGTIGRYENQTYMAEASSEGGGYDTLFSSAEHASPEYFSTYNKRVGDPEDGRPLRFLKAGDSMFQLSYNGVVHIYKSGKLRPIQIVRLHHRRGVTGKGAAHSSGNSVFMVSGLGLAVLNATDGGMGTITSADRVIFESWKSELSDIESCYDARMNASFFLNSTQEQILCLWHGTRGVTFLDGANFVGATSGPDIANGRNDRAFFITSTGLIVSPDVDESGSGTMWDISDSYTLNGTVTSGGSSLTDSDATFHADMVGAKLYLTSGDNAGDSRTIATAGAALTFTTPFDNDISPGDTYAVSPVPFKVRAWKLQSERVSQLNRWITTGVSVKARDLSGFTSNINNQWRLGGYRNGGSSLSSITGYATVSDNPAESAEALNLDGVDIEPYIEQVASGVKFELTDMEIAVSITDSRNEA